MKIKTSKNDMKILYVLLAISIILFISLLVFNNRENIRHIYDKSFKSVDDELSITYELVDNDNLSNVDFTVTVSSGNELEYIKYPDGQKIGINNKNRVSFDYNGANMESFTFEVKEKNQTPTNISFVLDATVYATGLTISNTGYTDTVYAGYGAQFQANFTPKNTTNKTVTWYSSNPSVATIDSNGKVTALRIGTTQITAKTTDGTNITSNSYTLKVKALELLNSFDKYIYLDATYGNDDTGDGTQLKPYKTLASLAKTGVIVNDYSYGIVLASGTYEFNNYRHLFTLTNNRTINLIGNREKTKIVTTNVIGTASSNVGVNTYTVRFYRLVLESTHNYYGWYIGKNGDRDFYNCVINIPDNFSLGYFYDGHANFYNCSILGACSKLVTVRNTNKIFQNNYGNLTYYKISVSSTGQVTLNTNYITSNPQYNSTTYRITDDESVWKNVGTGVDVDGTVADLGVYGGTLSWDYKDDIFY